MTKRGERKGLGRGLSALLGDIEPVKTGAQEAAEAGPAPVAPAGSRTATPMLPIERIHPNPNQPRREFREEELDELAASIRERGVIQPVVVRSHPEKTEEYQIVAGERRWRAAQRAGLHDLPVVIRELDDRTMLEVAIIENVQRADLNPIEEALGYAQLVERFGYTQEALARIVGKSRSHLANTLRLTGLPETVQAMLRDGRLSAGHARALLTAADPVGLARRAVEQGLTVREVERLARAGDAPAARPRGQRPAAEKDADTRLLEGDLSAAIGMRVALEHAAGGGGEMRIRYRDLDELDRLCQKLTD